MFLKFPDVVGGQAPWPAAGALASLHRDGQHCEKQ